MNLYHLKRLDSVGYDAYDAHVIRTWCEDRAREIANGAETFAEKTAMSTYRPGCEGATWSDPVKTVCVILAADVKEADESVICSSFNAG